MRLADKCISIKPDFAKGYSRKGAALWQQSKVRLRPPRLPPSLPGCEVIPRGAPLQLADAASSYEAGLKKIPGDPALTKSLADCRSKIAYGMRSYQEKQYRAQQQYAQAGPQWRSQTPAGFSRLCANLAVLVFIGLYVAGAATISDNGPSR